ncbi:outer membrane beta-barrel protein [Myxococcus sp. CA051A]|nr:MULTISPECIES: outer membrane beta-barrel protein [Myxococcus]NTX06233.1 outer membrane beta-barrel protein [Myxococcus sp. CA040A]NTX09494.1 outer membrane beta-barrel protein [Myxococcus sp. CA056]NTX34860.1 outer membrane beta-barrel protein [Myxococcus sp. CA033]NTX57940.1 outer membrane beta-barrel protein [Myxococcus sp. CA039A]NTX61085.1 outer membrane beta-barrel protein [Myxococcus sp. CA051A]
MRLFWLFAAVLLPTSAAFADETPGRHTHDGFYLRGQLGIAYTHSEAQEIDLALKGAGATINLELGYALIENFIIYGKLFGTSTPNPDIQFGDTTIEGDDDGDVSSNYAALGVGATYYFMPVNLYISGAVVANQLSITQDGEREAETDSGVGLHFGLGKEWWVSNNWAVGIGGEVALGRIRSDNDDGDDWNVTHFSLLFTATFN